ncbi:hypothetical protein K4S75_11155 [Staphylococcus epidermidis]|uniref:hypothetical protein n=1 Tax=Staphylococcus warneri TaxID=1292 RepID=UPI0022F13698|nr:hypothetical protein [Staphylococcus warneri]MCG1060603.1 hypothetical protein [Staphylococcus epidermidis]
MTHACIHLEEHATFDSIQAMDNTVRQYNARISKPHYETLNLLKQYSCKVIGVSQLKIKTMAKQLDKSVATIKRHIKYLKEQGFITVENTTRIKMRGKGANIYIINPIEKFKKVQRKIKNELSDMSHRNPDNEANRNQSQQAMRYVQVRNETIKSLKLLKSFISTKRRRKQQMRLNRVENIKYFRACPEGVPLELYQAYRPFFSDAQIKTLFNVITKQVNRYPSLDSEDYTNIVDNTFASIVKALRKYHRGERNKIKNIFAYAAGSAKKRAFKLTSMKMWGL